MKIPGPLKPAGVALIIVLAFLVLISGLTVAFLSSVTTELALSKTTANSATTVQLANSSVNLVMAQIVDATKGQDSSNAILAWASQPGMIRTFDKTGTAKNFFKLYSSDTMVVDGSKFQMTGEVPVAGWNSADKAGLYCDLNAPVLVTDPKGSIVAGSGTFSAVYPIVDPVADGLVDGFSITSPPGYNGAKPTPTSKDDPTIALLPNPSGNTSNPAPMPVKWLYVLRDGTVAPASGSGGSVTVTGASKSNPITGRMAFWTDDETCKVNINTASEGTYWDVPRIYSPEDFGNYDSTVHGFSMCQPVQHEYQRYPGHPATTCLSPIFGSSKWNPSLLPVTAPYPSNPQSSNSAKLDPYYNIAPRIGLPNGGGGGGSQGGSAQLSATGPVMTTDTDRLYASVDELMFTPTVSGTARVPNTSTTPTPSKITKDVLEKTRFFLTANSVAPETTLYNTPRIAVWPVSSNTGQRTTYDSLLAFCSTIGTKVGSNEYYFTRSNARSSTADYTGRNMDLYKYLQALTNKEVPGFGGTFSGKYGAGTLGATDCDQILTYIFDYIRCTNLQDQSLLPNNSPVTPFTPLFTGGGVTAPAGEVVPIKINKTQGFGRFYSITSANLLFYGTKKDAANKTTAMRAVFFLGFTTPQQGLACMRCNMKYKVTNGLLGTQKVGNGLADFQANGKSLNFKYDSTKGNGTNYMDVSDLSLFHGRSVGGTESPWQAIKGKPFSEGDQGGDASGKYPFFSSADVDVSGASSIAFTTTSPEITVEIWTKDTNQLIQVVHLAFPPGTFKIPGVVMDTSVNPPVPKPFGARTGGNYDSLVNTLDTVVALQVAGGYGNDQAPAVDNTAGDIRMTASLPDVPKERFRADNDYTTNNIQFAHCLVQSVGEPFNGAKYGKLANVSSYKQNNSIARQPDVPSRATTGVTNNDGGPGDWDTGFGDQKDGAYINKPDEGDTAFTDTTNGKTRLPYMLGYGAGFASAKPTYFSPNRQIPSPMMFGSIPTGVQRMRPWETLLFCPKPEYTKHPGNKSPKDHLIADLFWMPVVEPYAISQPFATDGKINMNYQIAPFTYINRSTGMQAVLKSTKFAALQLTDSTVYKPLDATANGVPPTAPNRRYAIDMTPSNTPPYNPETLVPFDTKFKSGEIFKSATQICEMDLVPAGQTAAGMAAFWTNNKLTGDNLREKPYADLYSRLTTKSNTYTVHICVQTLQKNPSGDPATFVDPNGSSKNAKDIILSEYRGSAIIERYIDLNDSTIPDFADPKNSSYTLDSYPDPTTGNMKSAYKFRVVSTKRFAP